MEGKFFHRGAAEERRARRCSLHCGFVLLLAISAAAQDTRTVTEPVVPSVCASVTARLRAVENGRTIAEADEAKPDTARIQQAIDGCPAGQAVALKPEGEFHAFLAGPLELRDGVTLLVERGATLFGSRNPRDYDLTAGSCGVVNKTGHGCKPLIAAPNVKNAAVMGDGTIDGRGWAKLTGQKDSWWDLAQQAKVANANQNCPRIIVATHADDFTLYRITLKNSPNFHVTFSGNGFTAWGVSINTPKTARNTDGIDPGNATNVTITHCFISAGDDNVAIKAGRPGPTAHMTIAHNHFYSGHGMSIGSETDGGASNILVTDLSIDGADNGIRIKSNSSRGGPVTNVTYKDVCIRDTKVPIYMDSNYSYYGDARDRLPQFTNIVLRDVRVINAGRIVLDGYDSSHRLGITFDNVEFDDPMRNPIKASHADITLGPGPVNFRPSGDDVRVTGAPGRGTPNACEGKFVPMK
jgi:polygalacturonase